MPRRDAVKIGSWLVVLAAFGLAGSRADAGAIYNITLLGDDYPIGINNQGDVGLASGIHTSNGGFGDARSYLYYPQTASVYHSLGPDAGTVTTPAPGGPSPSPGKGSTSPWINDSGDFATSDGTGSYVSIGGVRTDIPAYAPNVLVDPRAMNNAGQVVGESFMNPADAGYHAFLFDGGVKHDLGTLGGRSSIAEAINDAGTIVGWSLLPGAQPNQDGPVHAFRYDGTMHDLAPILGGGTSRAYGINGNGDIVGDMAADYSGPRHAFLLKDGKATDLNDFVPDDSPWHLDSALGINDLGQIIAIGSYRVDGNDYPSAFLLTPAGLGNPPPLPVPEPSTLALFGIAALALGLGRGERIGRLVRLSWSRRHRV